MSARPPSAYPNRRYSVAIPAIAMHENLLSICFKYKEVSERITKCVMKIRDGLDAQEQSTRIRNFYFTLK